MPSAAAWILTDAAGRRYWRRGGGWAVFPPLEGDVRLWPDRAGALAAAGAIMKIRGEVARPTPIRIP